MKHSLVNAMQSHVRQEGRTVSNWWSSTSASRKPRLRQLFAGALRALLCVVLVGLFTACGSGDDNGASNGERTIRVALTSISDDVLDPVMGGQSQNNQTLLEMYDTLLDIGPDTQIVGGLAQTWEVAPDNVTWTFHLRKGVQFHDGWGEVTAKDVKFSLERWGNPKGANSFIELINDTIDHVNVVDDYTVQIITKGPRGNLPNLLAPGGSSVGIVFSSKYLTEKAGNDFDAQVKVQSDHPIGSGPFKFVSYKRGDSLVYEAVANHWRSTPAVHRVEFLQVPELATQEAMLKSGEADIIEATGETVDRIQGDGMEVRSFPQSNITMVAIGGSYRPAAQQQPTKDIRVRKAMSLALDRQAIIDATLPGAKLPETPYGTSSVTADLDLNRMAELSKEVQRHDPDEAKRLLAEAGYPNGIDHIYIDTFDRTGAVAMPKLAEIIASQWASVGIKAELRLQDYQSYRPHYINAKESDNYNAGIPFTETTTPRFDAYTALSTWYSYQSQVSMLLKDPKLDELTEQIPTIIDDKQRMAVATQAFELAYNQWVFLPLFTGDVPYGVNSKTVGPWHTFPGFPYLGRVLETIK